MNTEPRQAGGRKSRPRLPERANGRQRFERLLQAAAVILDEHDPSTLTIKAIAERAGVPMASVYHFFPSTAAALLAVAHMHLAAFEAAVSQPSATDITASWRDIVAEVMERVVDHYRHHPSAARLLLGADTIAVIREADHANAEALAAILLNRLAFHFPVSDPDDLKDCFRIAIALADAIYALSVARHGRIDDHHAQQALFAVTAYVAARLEASSTDDTCTTRP